MDNFKRYAKILGVVILLALLATSAAGNYIYNKKYTELQATLKKNNEEFVNFKNKVKDNESGTALLKKQYEESASQCKTENDDLKAKIDAFAKQAAACEKIKEKLHLK